jgi:hypothetical protein
LNHDRLIRDDYVQNLPPEVFGVLMWLHCRVGATLKGHESGILCDEDGRRQTVTDFLYLYARGSEERAEVARRALGQLVRARQIKLSNPADESECYIKLVFWAEDQDLAGSGDVDRKRAAAEDARKEEAAQVAEHLGRWFKRLGRSATDAELLSFIKARRGGNPQQRTCESILDIWHEQGVLVRDGDGFSTLASLARSPLGTGSAGTVGSVGVGAGGEIFPDGKIPVELELNPDPDKGTLQSSQLDPVGWVGGGGASERSDEASPRSRASRDVPTAMCDFMFEPADADRVRDPVHAAEQFLSKLPGWNTVHSHDRPKSEYVLRGKWKDLRQRYGPKTADEMWRMVLKGVISDKIEGHAWNSWTGIFMARLKSFCESEDQVRALIET